LWLALDLPLLLDFLLAFLILIIKDGSYLRLGLDLTF
jgi:hypothetical protein